MTGGSCAGTGGMCRHPAAVGEQLLGVGVGTDRVFVPIPPSDRDDQVRSPHLIGRSRDGLRKTREENGAATWTRTRVSKPRAEGAGSRTVQSQAPYTCTCSLLSWVRFHSWRASSTQKFTHPWLWPTKGFIMFREPCSA